MDKVFVENKNEVFQLVLDSIPSRVFWKDLNLIYRGANNHFMADAGKSCLTDLVGKSDYDLPWSEEQANAFRADDREVINSGVAKLNIEEDQTQPDGSVSWLQTCKIPLHDDQGAVIGVLGTYTDITDRKSFQDTIEYQATHDELTSLPNRRYLQAAIEDFLVSERAGFSGLIFIDLDRFKIVNDSLGHAAGDKLLRLVSERIKQQIAGEDVAARLGGDEFSFLIVDAGADEETARSCLSEISSKIVDSLLRPFSVDEHVLYIGASVGCSIIQPSNKNSSDKLREADMAMYQAKDMGRNTFAFYSDVMMEKANRRHEVQNCLRQALKNNEFNLVYQPQYGTNGKLLGAEALLRWHSAQLGFVSPAEFIPEAEHTGLIYDIGKWVIHTAGQAYKTLSNTVEPSFIMAINVSAIQFQQDDFVSSAESLITQCGVSPASIQLEITESLLLGNESQALKKLDQLKQLGFSIAIDDFGTGYSSLSYLTRLPIDKLKIDQSFVRKISTDDRNARIVETIINMSKNLNLEVIAEGVETECEKQFLLERGCYQFQGYLFSKPVELSQFEQLVK